MRVTEREAKDNVRFFLLTELIIVSLLRMGHLGKDNLKGRIPKTSTLDMGVLRYQMDILEGLMSE